MITLISISDSIDKIRVKSEEEIKLIQKAAEIVDKTYDYFNCSKSGYERKRNQGIVEVKNVRIRCRWTIF